MELEVIIGLIGSGVTAIGVSTGFILSLVKAKKEMKIIEQKEAEEQAARIKAEKQKFYLTTAANLVISAEKLALTGPQKKEYVMTWLENEAVKAGIEVDKALMSVAIERTILILNDHKDKTKPVAPLLQSELDDAVEQEQLRINAQAANALNTLDKTSSLAAAKTAEAIGITKRTITDVKSILNKK